MTTYAQRAGLTVGRQYIVNSDRPSWKGTWTFQNDDGTPLPYFNRPDDVDSTVCIYVTGEEHTTFTPVEQDGEEDFNIDVKFKKGGVVDISISKKLTADQVSAILKIAGV